MRRTLQNAAILGLIFIWTETLIALYGPHRLAGRIPVHFDAAGHVNGWGTPGMLWMLPAVATAVLVLMTWVKRHPSAFNYPVRVTPATRPCLESLTCTLIAWLEAEIVWLFALIQWTTIKSARTGTGSLPAFLVPGAIVVVWGTIIFYVVTIVRAARRPGGRK